MEKIGGVPGLLAVTSLGVSIVTAVQLNRQINHQAETIDTIVKQIGESGKNSEQIKRLSVQISQLGNILKSNTTNINKLVNEFEKNNKRQRMILKMIHSNSECIREMQSGSERDLKCKPASVSSIQAEMYQRRSDIIDDGGEDYVRKQMQKMNFSMEDNEW